MKRAGISRGAVLALLLGVGVANAQVALEPAELDVLGEVLGGRIGKTFRKAEGEERRQIVAEYFAAQPEAIQGLMKRRLAHVAGSFGEGGQAGGLTDRGLVFLTLGPPTRIHEEASRSWSGKSRAPLETPADVVGEVLRWLQGEAPTAGSVPLSGSPATHVWVHSVRDDPSKRRVVYFVDDGTGRLRLAGTELVPAGASVSTAPGSELPADVFAQTGLGQSFEPLPELDDDSLTLTVTHGLFKADDAKTYTRFAISVDPDDIELELDAEPEPYMDAATLWLRVESGGNAVFQAECSRKEGTVLVAEGRLMAEFGVPLLPGSYSWEVRMVGPDAAGGSDSGSVDVPSLTGSLALSTLVLAPAAEGSEPFPAATKDEDGAPAPFTLGSYVVRPRLPAIFKRGETLAVVCQVYGQSAATLELDVFKDGVYQGTLDENRVDLPHTEIQLIDVLDAWPDGNYKVRLTAKGKGAESIAEARFRVKG